jgi:hypothetical protein
MTGDQRQVSVTAVGGDLPPRKRTKPDFGVRRKPESQARAALRGNGTGLEPDWR